MRFPRRFREERRHVAHAADDARKVRELQRAMSASELYRNPSLPLR